MRLVVVTVADVGGSNEELKRVILIQIQGASFNLLLQLSHALLPIAVHIHWDTSTAALLSPCRHCNHLSGWSLYLPAKAQIFFIAPKHRGSSSDSSFRQHVMQDHDLDQRKTMTKYGGSC